MIDRGKRACIGCCLALLMVLSMQFSNFAVFAATDAASDVQTLVVDPTGQGEGYSAVLYDNSNGLPTSEANALAQTADGFIWIGSYSGLMRYDGNTFERIDSTSGIANVMCLFVDSEDRLWVGTNDSGVAVMEKDDCRFFNQSDGMNALSIRAITEDQNGVFYIGTTQGVAIVDDRMLLHVLDEPLLNEEYIRAMRVGEDNTVYGVTNSGAVFTMRNGELVDFYDAETMGVEGIRTIQPDAQRPGYAFICTSRSEIYHGKLYNGLADVSVINVALLDYVNSINQINGQLWVCADNGISVVQNGVPKKLENIPVDSSIEDIMIDYQGNLWVASSKQGVMKIVPNQFTDVFERNHLPSSVVNTTCVYRGQLLIGGQSTGLTVLDLSGGQVETMPLTKATTASGEDLGGTDLIEMLAGSRIRSMVTDSKQRLWISTYGDNALLRYKDGEVVRFGEEDGMPSNRVRTVFERQDGSFLAACSGGLAVIEGDTVTKVYDESSGINNREVLTVIETKNKDILIGTDGDGIYLIQGDSDQAAHIGLQAGLSSGVVMRLKESVSGDIVWIVTSNSIGYMNGNYEVTTVRNFPYSNNFDLYENSKGEMWVLSSNGIYVLPTEEMIANESIHPVYYGRDNGLSCIATANSYSELTDSGDLYIAGTTGVAKVNIEETFENVSDVKMGVPCVEADGKRIFADDAGKITIPSSTRKLTIYSYVFNYSLMNPQVTYRLDGFDKHATTVQRSELGPIDYTNLKGGNYHFVMQLSDSQGNGNNELSVEILKEKVLHELWWFRLVCVAAGGLLVAGIVVLYIHKKTKEFKEKEKQQKLLIREIVEAFAKVIDMKDAYTNGHSTRVAEYTVMLARELGYDEETIENFYNIALLHDIGKVGIPPEVLNKPGKLTDREFMIIKSHTTLGYETLKGISIMPELAIGAGSHHERPDGKGYPKRLKGDEIPRVAQIIAVADTFDAMYSNRPYRKRMNFEKAVSIIKSVRGTQLTADVVDAFLRLVDKGQFRAPDDFGDGTTEDIDNIHKKFNEQEKKDGK